jgi:hypothetical protein
MVWTVVLTAWTDLIAWSSIAMVFLLTPSPHGARFTITLARTTTQTFSDSSQESLMI